MFGFFGFPTPAQLERRAAQERREAARRIPLCVPWDPKIKFQKELNIQAATYPFWDVFPGVTPCRVPLPRQVLAKGNDYYRLSPDERFLYSVKQIKAGETIETYYGKQRGTVLFDGPVKIPVLNRKFRWDDNHWEDEPWMSTTPMEVLSLRGGTRLAKGHTVIAGLGLGYQLCAVSKRAKVQKITLVEENQALVDWIMPALKDKLGPVPVDVIVDDAHQAVPKLTADVALIDIFHRYGSNTFDDCPNIPRVWCWGSQQPAGG